MRPVLRHLITYDKLVEIGLDLEDIARMNDALDVQDENEYRAHEAMKSERDRR